MGPLPQTRWRSTDGEKDVQRWDPCHVDWIEIFHRYREDSKRTSHADLWRWRLYGDGTPAMWTQRRSIDVEKEYGDGTSAMWTPWRSIDVEKAVRRWDLCHVDSGEILLGTENAVETGPLPNIRKNMIYPCNYEYTHMHTQTYSACWATI